MKAIGDDLRRRLLVPGHQADGVGIGPQPDVPVDRIDDILFRIVAGDRLDEDAFRQAQAVGQGAQELVAGQNFAARDAVDVGHDALDLCDAALLQPGFEVGHDALRGGAADRETTGWPFPTASARAPCLRWSQQGCRDSLYSRSERINTPDRS